MSSEKAAPNEVPAREPAQDTASSEKAPASPPKQDREASEDAKESAGDAGSTTPERASGSPATDDKEQGEVSEDPPLPDGAPPDANPPLPSEPAPAPASDDGWDYRWDYALSRYVFFNRLTGAETLENPRMPAAPSHAQQHPATAPEPPAITGYNPAIHGDYDPNAWYAKLHEDPSALPPPQAEEAHADGYDATALFNRFTGQHQTEGAGRHTDEAKSRRQMNAYFDVDAAANAHDGRSLKAERAGKKPSKNELKFFKEKRRARKEEKRRAWLRD